MLAQLVTEASILRNILLSHLTVTADESRVQEMLKRLRHDCTMYERSVRSRVLKASEYRKRSSVLALSPLLLLLERDRSTLGP